MTALLAGALFVAAPGQAHGEPVETARLTYRVPASLSACPDEESFRNQVAARLGYEAFAENGKHAVQVELSVEHGRIHGRAEVALPGHAASDARARELEAPLDECTSLVSALATAVAIALDPGRSALPPAPVAPVPPSIPVTAPAPVPAIVVTRPTQKPTPPASPRVKLAGVADAIVSVDQAPGPTLGGEVGAALSSRFVSLELLGRIDAMVAPVHVRSGNLLEASVFSAVLSPCTKIGPWIGCLLGRLGAFEGRDPEVTNGTVARSVFASVGARAGYVLALGDQLALRGLVFAEAPIVRTSLFVSGGSVWSAPPLLAGLALGADFSTP